MLPENVIELCHILHEKVHMDDPVHGAGFVNVNGNLECTVWCEASDLAMGVALEVDDNIVEECCWLQKHQDKKHINIVDVKMVVKMKTDSKTVFGWVSSIVHNIQRVKVTGWWNGD